MRVNSIILIPYDSILQVAQTIFCLIYYFPSGNISSNRIGSLPLA